MLVPQHADFRGNYTWMGRIWEYQSVNGWSTNKLTVEFIENLRLEPTFITCKMYIMWSVHFITHTTWKKPPVHTIKVYPIHWPLTSVLSDFAQIICWGFFKSIFKNSHILESTLSSMVSFNLIITIKYYNLKTMNLFKHSLWIPADMTGYICVKLGYSQGYVQRGSRKVYFNRTVLLL